ncbi:putative transcription factor WRKY family [Helianthus annuus]|uniref:Putative WRKY domain-containing protein n=1 Tax=Helianthus annuus TaxID=4232 RepID=A0A251RPZ9_HELAN|nr:putative transcription factor WRKY family [Helianthus annuus]KAJ0569528.1 putative transcription factor WRKY family [Helianthus annuus]KAJ0583839.1 putative transcription factor WRKY family [Helianthus annuus]KAJ0918077.1 putative transcription factor WRKY family [Helianthus annuus]KAJ0959562.1 putative transcription factor WRKY family [Helianthus annuus]
MKQVKSPEGGSRSYYKCAFSACDAKKIESCDRYNFTVKIVYKGQHKHDPPKRVASKGGELLKRKLISTPPIQVEQIDHLEIKQRWKKYGQKMVKGTPHPRNYYKCTSAGCTVSKHIEKVIDGSSEVTITYKGVHDHNMPVPKKDRAHLPLLLLKTLYNTREGSTCPHEFPPMKQPGQMNLLKPEPFCVLGLKSNSLLRTHI